MVEAGKANIRASTAIRLADAIGVPSAAPLR
jgi:hypothetical protein